MTFSRKALWSFLVGTLAAIPVFHGIPEITHETAAALDEITTVVKKSAAEAIHARQVASTADDDAKKGTVVVHQAVVYCALFSHI